MRHHFICLLTAINLTLWSTQAGANSDKASYPSFKNLWGGEQGVLSAACRKGNDKGSMICALTRTTLSGMSFGIARAEERAFRSQSAQEIKSSPLCQAALTSTFEEWLTTQNFEGKYRIAISQASYREQFEATRIFCEKTNKETYEAMRALEFSLRDQRCILNSETLDVTFTYDAEGKEWVSENLTPHKCKSTLYRFHRISGKKYGASLTISTGSGCSPTPSTTTYNYTDQFGAASKACSVVLY